MKYLLLIFALLPFSFLFSQELVPLKKGDKYAFFLGEERVTPFQYDEVSEPHEMGYVVSQMGGHGLVDLQGREVIPTQYDYLRIAGPEAIIASQNGRAGVLDAQGNEQLPFLYDKVDQFSPTGTAVVKKDGRWAVLRQGVLDNDVSKVVFRFPDLLPLYAGTNRKRFNEIEKQQQSAKKLIEYIVYQYFSDQKVLKNRIDGSATVAFIITAEGKVRRPWVEGTNSQEMAEILVDIVERMPQWSRVPMVDGQPVAMEYRIPVELNFK